MNYTVIFLFSEDLSEVLLVKKEKGCYPNTLNGIGGVIQEGCTWESEALRHIKEETAIELEESELNHLMNVFMTYPAQKDVCLGVYCARIDNALVQRIKDEEQIWLSSSGIISCLGASAKDFAGDGNLPYFVNVAFKTLKREAINEYGEG